MGIKGLEAFSHDPGVVANRDLYCLSTISVPVVAVMTCSELCASLFLKQVLKFLLAGFFGGHPEEEIKLKRKRCLFIGRNNNNLFTLPTCL